MPTQKLLVQYPKRGEIYLADLHPTVGWEMHKKRPVLVISTNALNKVLPTVVIIPFSSIVPTYVGPDLVKVETGDTGLSEKSVLVANQIRTIDKERLKEQMGTLPRPKMFEVEEAIRVVFELH